LPLEEDLEKIIGKIWFVKNNFESIVKHELVMKRAESVKDVVTLMAHYDPKKVKFDHRLILDNFTGGLQHYLTGYDLYSIHLSSRSLEVACLFKVVSPVKGERYSSFGDLCKIVTKRGLVKQKGTVDAAWNVINRRNMTVHDALLEQAVLWVYDDWLKDKLKELPREYRPLFSSALNPLMIQVRNKLKQFDSLPDLRWYIRTEPFETTKKLIVDFLEQIIGRMLFPLKSIEGKGIMAFLSQIPKVIDIAKMSLRYEADFLEYSARENIKDVKIVLEELYNSKLFKF